MAENEVTCLRLAADCGLTVPDVELLDVNGNKILAIRRYDRTEVDSALARIHQEDGCQARGTPPVQKYQYAGGPSLKDLAIVLRDHGDVGAMRELLQRVAFNVAIGNADAHAKNFSFLHGSDGLSITLAPVYDVLSTISLEKRPNADGIMEGASTTMGQEVNGQTDILRVSKADIVSEGTKWGLRRKASEECVAEVFDAVSASLVETSGDESVLSVIRAQLIRASS
jgi:serine/threonine-protein kinase HipA